MKAGFIGLGAMGYPMALNLHKAGLLTAVYNRSGAKAAALARETGCVVAKDISELARHCDAVVTCITADQDVLEVTDALTGNLKQGALVIDCSTVNAATARETASRLAKHGVEFLDCPVSGGTEGAKHGTLAIMCGGDPQTFQRAQPILNALGKRIVLMGPVGAGQATKAVNQIAIAGIAQAVTEALAFAEAEGLPLEKVIDVVGGGAAGSWFLSHRGPSMAEGRYPLGFKVGLHDKDLGIVQQMAAAHRVQLPVVEMTRLHYRRLQQDGHGDEDISALFRLKRRLFGH
ncbi:MAG: NAD(P)-dependent oxidoreductase [Gammaproteobacteria bacterium]|nr:NAD(P)-dependent oxidoreductase [Gammaproteobacteria bacterium]MBU6510046.1 NAD(P)-dependent oxidoreductase [Gammaproteobacteria bacterium]MDE1984273.1 NAD(P)-dependent oxidoreductase [Gammaproteobacteria bacterium]MDE2108390.1 NAD(P)-dependent oxidoreductase [Gammaproteobacteria bacterium]